MPIAVLNWSWLGLLIEQTFEMAFFIFKLYRVIDPIEITRWNTIKTYFIYLFENTYFERDVFSSRYT